MDELYKARNRHNWQLPMSQFAAFKAFGPEIIILIGIVPKVYRNVRFQVDFIRKYFCCYNSAISGLFLKTKNHQETDQFKKSVYAAFYYSHKVDVSYALMDKLVENCPPAKDIG